MYISTNIMFHSNKIYYFFFRYSHHIKVKSFLKYHEVLTSSLIFSQDTPSMILYENLRNILSKRRCLKIYEFNFRNKLILTDEFFEFVHISIFVKLKESSSRSFITTKCSLPFPYLAKRGRMPGMAIRVVEFSSGGYKIRKIFA